MHRPPLTEEQVRAALAEADGSPTEAARLLQRDRTTVWRAMRRYGIEVKRVVTAH